MSSEKKENRLDAAARARLRLSMHLIIRPGINDAAPFADLIDRPDQQEALVRYIIQTVTRSYAEAVAHLPPPARAAAIARARSDTEDRRRAQICFEALRAWRHHGYALQRACDELPRALRAALEGTVHPIPAPGRIWSPDGGIRKDFA
jgi:hypothetical protein